MVSFMPLPLIPTRPDALLEPGHDIRDIRDELGNGMALVHNSFICNLNAIYHHADKEYVMKDLDNFLTYVNAFYLVLKYHSEAEERFVFPTLMKYIPDMQQNIHQHEPVHHLLAEMEELIDEGRKDHSTASGKRLREIIDKYSADLYQHLADEILTLDPAVLKATISMAELLPMLKEGLEWEIGIVTTPILLPFLSGGRSSTKEDVKKKLPSLVATYEGAWKYCPYNPLKNEKQSVVF